MIDSLTVDPWLGFAQTSLVMQSTRAIWRRFLSAVPESNLKVEHCWLILQLYGEARSPEELHAELSLAVDQPSELIAESLSLGIVEQQGERITLSPTIREQFGRFLPHAQEFNQQWRQQLVDTGLAPEEVQFVLSMLQGT